ncbi:MAG: hypothetical protein WAJ93_21660 [Candidatus Nitrosopolaris sp.]
MLDQKYAASDPSIKTVVLLSQGLNYKGVIKEIPIPLKKRLA